MSISRRYRYQVALSFAGENRAYAQDVCKHLQVRGHSVFYDEDPSVQAKHLGERFSDVAERVYGEGAMLVVMFVSTHYVSKEWPFLEGALILDRMRKELFQTRQVLIGKFDNSRLPGFPGDILSRDLTRTTPAEWADLIHARLEELCTIDRDHILLHFSRKRYDLAREVLSAALTRDLSYEDRVFALYNRACANACLSIDGVGTGESSDHLLAAAGDLDEVFRIVSEQRPEFRAEFAIFANEDDDLARLRIALPDRVQQILGVCRLNRSYTGSRYKNMRRGCVDPATQVLTPNGLTCMRDIRTGDALMAYDLSASSPLCSTVVLRKLVFELESRYQVNGKLTISDSQPLYERDLGWSCVAAWRPGMALLRADGNYEKIECVQPLSRGPVEIVSIADSTHTFVAAGYVCHNADKR